MTPAKRKAGDRFRFQRILLSTFVILLLKRAATVPGDYSWDGIREAGGIARAVQEYSIPTGALVPKTGLGSSNPPLASRRGRCETQRALHRRTCRCLHFCQAGPVPVIEVARRSRYSSLPQWPRTVPRRPYTSSERF